MYDFLLVLRDNLVSDIMDMCDFRYINSLAHDCHLPSLVFQLNYDRQNSTSQRINVVFLKTTDIKRFSRNNHKGRSITI